MCPTSEVEWIAPASPIRKAAMRKTIAAKEVFICACFYGVLSPDPAICSLHSLLTGGGIVKC
jgi:hypothetical protein